MRIVWSDRSGSSAVEFALIMPAFVALLVGGFYLALLGFALSNMHNAAESAARCASVKTTICKNSTTTAAYAASRMRSAGATFTSSNATCGHRVSGTMTYRLSAGITSFNVPLSVSACFP